jgi:hypothetical protein
VWVSVSQPTKRDSSSSAWGPEDEVEVVGQDGEGEQSRGHLVEGVGEGADEGVVVGGFVEYFGSSVGAIEDVIDESRLGGSGWSWHGRTLPRLGPPCKSVGCQFVKES